jgi:hypothetical protein
MRFSLAGLLLVGACTSPIRSKLHGTWERVDAQGAVLERMTFDSSGRFTATATRSGGANEIRRDEWRDLRDTSGSYLVSGGMVMLRGHTGDDIRYDLDFTYYVDADVFVRGAFVEYEDNNPGDWNRHFRARHSVIYGGMNDIGHARALDADLRLTDIGDTGFFGMSFVDPLFGGQTGDGGIHRRRRPRAPARDLRVPLRGRRRRQRARQGRHPRRIDGCTGQRRGHRVHFLACRLTHNPISSHVSYS